MLQVLEITNRAVVCLNLMDEARRRGIEVDARRLARDLGVRVVPAAARYNEGLPELTQAIAEVARGEVGGDPAPRGRASPALQRAVTRLGERGARAASASCRTRSGWRSRLLDGDERIQAAMRAASSAISIQAPTPPGAAGGAHAPRAPDPDAVTAVIELASQLRWQVGSEFHQSLMEAVYTEAARIADRAVTRAEGGRRFDLDRTIDRLVTSRRWGVPLMLAMLTGVFWLTIARRERAVGDAGHAAHRLDGAGAALGRRRDRHAVVALGAASSTACTWPRPGW